MTGTFVRLTHAEIRPERPACFSMRRRTHLQVAFDTAGYFGLTAKNARALAADVGAVLAQWREEAAAFGLTKSG